MTHPVVLAITGASGVVYGQRLLELLIDHAIPVQLSISESGQKVLQHELGIDLDLDRFQLQQLLPHRPVENPDVAYHHYKDFMTPIASGSFRTSAMVICPCSGSTLSGIAAAASGNLIQRAADVHLKEKRPLIIVPRETPLSLLQIQNMEAVARAGATVLPASPGFYHGCDSVANLIDFVVARILDHLHIEHDLIKRWGGNGSG
jgi:4-hydroxy-3-polyprenylbenzoate decarboxylase